MNQQNHSRHQILQSVPQGGHIMHIYDHAHMCTLRLFSFLLVIASTGEGLWGQTLHKEQEGSFHFTSTLGSCSVLPLQPCSIAVCRAFFKKKKKKSIRRVSINLPSGALILPLNWVNRIVYLKGRTL